MARVSLGPVLVTSGSRVLRRRAFVLERKCPVRRKPEHSHRRPVQFIIRRFRTIPAEKVLPTAGTGSHATISTSGPIDRGLGLVSLMGIGAAVTSSWRGLWYIMDGTIFPDDLFLSGCTSIVLGWSTFAITHYCAMWTTPLTPGRIEADLARMPAIRQALLTYVVGVGIIATWRGVWVLWDAAYEKVTGVKAVDQSVMSGLLSHVVGIGILTASGYLASLMAPPLRLCIFNNRDLWHFLRPGP
mmetsp:Transcript_27283/g.50052  ORF Transcript_27283/g.50052 Transcript_27283/m.50052 type:complete len:243 (-) Transcript_27283:111-839(-)